MNIKKRPVFVRVCVRTIDTGFATIRTDGCGLDSSGSGLGLMAVLLEVALKPQVL